MKTLITVSNTKLGGHIAQLNFPPGATCRPDAPCKKDCYARRHHFQMQPILHSMQDKLDFYMRNPEGFFKCLDYELTMIPYRFMRYFSSGDIVDDVFFFGMVKLAKQHPGTKFLCFTKKYELVNDYLYSGKKIPCNLIVVFSNWGEWICKNPFNLPMAWVMLRDAYIPDNARHCKGFCPECITTSEDCWNMAAGDNVKFRKH